MKYLRIYRCPAHAKNLTLTIEAKEGNGVRIGGAKCCPRQYTDMLAEIMLDPARVSQLFEELCHD